MIITLNPQLVSILLTASQKGSKVALVTNLHMEIVHKETGAE